MPRNSRSPEPAPILVKLGGSLGGAPRLKELLAALADAGAPLVLVPGGGPLADAVRDLQPRLALSEHACHHMAILAMEAFALALADLEPRLALAADEGAIAGAHGQGRAALWLPAGLARAADLPESWNVTSDSLALWLAIRLGASRLVLVKSTPAATATPEEWAAAGLVDPHVPVLAARFAGRFDVLSADEALSAFTRDRSAA